MINDFKNCSSKNPSVLSGVSFTEVLDKVKVQIDIDCFADRDAQFADEISYIIAEVMKLDPECDIRIEGAARTAGMVQEVYSKIEHEHVQQVIDTFRAITHEIKNKKAYLRTALYNSVFELEASGINLYKSTI
jgi:hypothetical protein